MVRIKKFVYTQNKQEMHQCLCGCHCSILTGPETHKEGGRLATGPDRVNILHSGVAILALVVLQPCGEAVSQVDPAARAIETNHTRILDNTLDIRAKKTCWFSRKHWLVLLKRSNTKNLQNNDGRIKNVFFVN